MIDEKKITEAINTYIGYAKEGIETSMRRDAFRVGVKWYKQALWHEATEMPEKGKAFIFLAESNSSKHYHVGVVYNPMDYDKNCEWWGVIEWCYIEDLLPKGGNV